MPIHDGSHHDRLSCAAAQSGWSATDQRCAAFATREVKSIGKTDTAYLYWHREGNTLILTGQYISEGNNVLSRLYGRVAADANDSDLNLAVSVFVGLVNASINDTKMVRLYNDANTLH